MALAMTCSDVNPVIAVVVGWLLIDEPVTVTTAAVLALIVAGVSGVFREKADGQTKTTRPADG